MKLLPSSHTETQGSTQYPVHWVSNRVLYREPWRKRERPFFIGICGYTARPFTVATTVLSVAIVRDLFLTPGQVCEEGKRCLYVECALNHTTMQTFARGLGWKRVPKWLREQGLHSMRLSLPARRYLKKLCADHPRTGVVVEAPRQ